MLRAFAVASLAVIACGPPQTAAPCTGDGDCALEGGGRCLPSPLGANACAYPDLACPGGYHWGDLTGSLAGQCLGEVDAGTDGTDAAIDAGQVDGPPPTGWAALFSSTATDFADAVAVTADGSVYVAGTFSDNASLAGEPTTSSGVVDMFVVHFAANGQRRWVRRFGSTGMDSAQAVAARPDGGAVVTGFAVGSVDFGAGPIAGSVNGEAVAVGLSAVGATQWVAHAGGAGTATFSKVTVGSDGSAYVLGTYSGTIRLGLTDYTAVNSNNLLVAKISPAGEFVWSRAFGGPGISAGVTLLAGGDVVVAATFTATVDAGGGPLVTAGTNDIVLARLASANGAHVWSKRLGSPNSDLVKALASTQSGFSIVGCFAGTTSLGGASHASAGQLDAFAGGFAADGTLIWSKAFGSGAQDCATATTGDGASTMVTGTFAGSLTIGTTSVTSVGGEDVWVAKLSGDGTPLSARSGGGPTFDTPTGIAVFGAYFTLTGNSGGAPNMFGHQLATGGMMDGFVVQSQQ